MKILKQMEKINKLYFKNGTWYFNVNLVSGVKKKTPS